MMMRWQTKDIGATLYFKNLNVWTKSKRAYTPETINESVVSLETEWNTTVESAINNIEGSGWASCKYNKLYMIWHTSKTARSGSYIKTPENIITLTVD